MDFRLEHIVSSLLTVPNSGAPATPFPDSAFEVDRFHHSASPVDEDSLVSIIIPCYNGEAYLQEAIESALAQTHPEVEIIVVDDGSVDNSLEVLAQYNGRIKVITIPNGGQLGAVRAGIITATSDYIYTLDADDFADPRLVSTEVVLPDLRNALLAGTRTR